MLFATAARRAAALAARIAGQQQQPLQLLQLQQRTLATGSPATPLSVLVIDGYSKDGRTDLEAGGASTAGKLYQELLRKCTPRGNVVADIVYPADDDFATPDLSNVSELVLCVLCDAHVCSMQLTAHSYALSHTHAYLLVSLFSLSCSMRQYHAVAWTGCSLTIHETHDVRVSKQIAFAKQVFEHGACVRMCACMSE